MVHRARDTIPRALTNQSRRAHSRRFSARAASNIAKKFQTLRSVTPYSSLNAPFEKKTKINHRRSNYNLYVIALILIKI